MSDDPIDAFLVSVRQWAEYHRDRGTCTLKIYDVGLVVAEVSFPENFNDPAITCLCHQKPLPEHRRDAKARGSKPTKPQ